MTPTRVRSLFRRARRDRGANLVEFALVTTFVLLPLLVGVVDIGRAFYAYVTITNAAREGARMASKLPYDNNYTEAYIIGVVEDQVRGEPSMPTFNWDTIDVDIKGLGGAPGQAVAVTASFEFETILGGIVGIGGTIPMSSRTEMVIFGTDGTVGDIPFGFPTPEPPDQEG